MCIYLRIGLARRRRRRRVCVETRARHAATLVARRRRLNAAAVTEKRFSASLARNQYFPLSISRDGKQFGHLSPPPRKPAAAEAASARCTLERLAASV